MTTTPAAVFELSDPYRSYMLSPALGPGICSTCLTFIESPYEQCRPCSQHGDTLAAATAISYSHQDGQLHHTLRTYKSPFGGRGVRDLQYQLTAVLWRHLLDHERCLAHAAGVEGFPVVTTVPSTSTERDLRHPLPQMVGEWIRPTAERYQRILTPTGHGDPHRFHLDRFAATSRLDGEPVLLIDDTWTAGANAFSAATSLTAAGAGPVTALVIGRYIRTGERDHRKRLDAVPRPFRWDQCPHHER